MSYPSLEQYTEALQHPQFALHDPELKQAIIARNGLGLPLALCGGFALTYTLSHGSKKYAVRCFHKQSDALETRYQLISRRLQGLQSDYFLEFEFQPHGVLVAGQNYPVVKMAWADGLTLGEFLEQHHQNPAVLEALRKSLAALAGFLEAELIAHGDISPDNIMVRDAGRRLQLIDYDGMFVEQLKSFQSTELGNRNFQHPARTSAAYNHKLDRFGFILLELALMGLIQNPQFWRKTQSDANAVIFRANDFADPGASAVFRQFLDETALAVTTRHFAAICKASFDVIPSLAEFKTQINIPAVAVLFHNAPTTAKSAYLSAFPVLDAGNYAQCLAYVGDKVELIGRIVEVKRGRTRFKKPYVFINFGPWQGHIVKITIWSGGLNSLAAKPTPSWVGKWVSVVGLMEPPFVNDRYHYSHLAISISQGNQLHVLSEAEALFRLSGATPQGTWVLPVSSNQAILQRLKGQEASPAHTTTIAGSSNRAILQNLKGGKASPPHRQYQRKPGKNSPVPGMVNQSNCFIASAIYGPDASQTQLLRQWRDRFLLPHGLGRLMIAVYYRLAPPLLPLIRRHGWLQSRIRKILDGVVNWIG